jgi:hypothetical protein
MLGTGRPQGEEHIVREGRHGREGERDKQRRVRQLAARTFQYRPFFASFAAFADGFASTSAGP